MKRLPWLLVALIPAISGFFDYLGTSMWPLVLGFSFFCLLGSYFLVAGIKRVWLRVLVTILLGALFFLMDASIAIFVGCSRSPGHY